VWLDFYHSSDVISSSHCLSDGLYNTRQLVVRQSMGHDLFTWHVDINGATYRGMLPLPTTEHGDFSPATVRMRFHCCYGYATRSIPFQASTTGRVSEVSILASPG
jgi:hypothetical protein